MLIINILDTLKKYTDENHRLSQKDIIEILDKEYCIKIDRKSVKRNLMNLIEFGYDIEYSESIRLVKDKNGEKVETKILSDFYLNRSFTDGELRLLIDSVLFSNHISYSQCRDLVEKLDRLIENAGSADIILTSDEVSAIDNKLDNINMSAVFGGSKLIKKRK